MRCSLELVEAAAATRTERDDQASGGASVTPEDEPTQDARTGASATAADEPPGAQQPAAAAPVRLGERFAWCAKVQALWDAQDEARANTETAALTHEAAIGIYAAATDDLDRAEASEAVDDAYAAYVLSTRDYGRAPLGRRWAACGRRVGSVGSRTAGLDAAGGHSAGSRRLPHRRHPTHAHSA